MAFLYSTYYGLTRISDTGPETKGWSATDSNFETLSRLIHAVEGHRHTASTPIFYPGYNSADPSTPTFVTLTEVTSGGFLPPGSNIGVRAAYVDPNGLETDASPEKVLTLGSVPTRPTAPTAGSPTSTPVAGALVGGTYIYALTKQKSTGETQISDSVSINVPFAETANTTYTVPITFEPLNTYSGTDGSTALRLYRTTGFNTSFVLLKTITTADQSEYTDTNAIESATTQPPIINTFGKNKKVAVDISGLSHPALAERLRLYITTQPSTWGTQNLFKDILLSTPYQSTYDFLGNEVLDKGWPQERTQVVGRFQKIDLGAEAVGGPTLTAHQNFNGYQAVKFRFPIGLAASTPMEGAAYIENTTATPSFRVRVGGNYQTLVVPGGSYSHSTNEAGGHSSTNIYFSTNPGGNSVYDILSVIATPVGLGAQYRKPVQTINKIVPTTANYQTTSASLADLSEMSLTNIVPDFAGQWMEFVYGGAFYINPQGTNGATLSTQLEINGNTTLLAETYRSFTAPTSSTPIHAPIHATYATPVSTTITSLKVKWLTSSGTVTSIGPRRTFYVKELF